jgi:hypothetical protein
MKSAETDQFSWFHLWRDCQDHFPNDLYLMPLKEDVFRLCSEMALELIAISAMNLWLQFPALTFPTAPV